MIPIISTSSKFFAPLSLSSHTKLAPQPLTSSTLPSLRSAVQSEDKPLAQQLQQPMPNNVPTFTKQNTNEQIPAISTNNSSPSTRNPGMKMTKASSLPAFLCNAADDIINNFIDPPVLRPSADPRHILIDNFAPVDELPPTPCPLIRGKIPACIAGGVYIRNGPNPQHLPRGPYHLFDGDGMLHSLLAPSSAAAAATYSSRFVHTYKYNLENFLRSAVLPSPFSSLHGAASLARGAVTMARIITGQLDPRNGIGNANTSLSYFGQRLYALGESDLPYELFVSPYDGDITTVGRADFEGKLSMAMTAHPKLDPSTSEVFAFRYGPSPPFLTYFRFDAQGNKAGVDVPIFSVRSPTFVHDFAITEKYAVFSDIQMVVNPMDVVVGGGAPFGSDASKVPRIGVLPRYADSEMEIKWFDVPGFNPIHLVNAWDDGDELVVLAPNVIAVEHAPDRMELIHSCMEMVRIDLRGGEVVTRTPLAADNLDFGLINPGYVARKSRYAYLGIMNPMPKISGIVKLDVELAGNGDCVVARRDFGPGKFGGEPFYVAKGESKEEDEDDGYLLSYVHDEINGKSSFIIMDAKSPELEVVAEVALPRRVPYGFHGIFVTAKELMAQSRKRFNI